jgi:hypothetical protein
VDSWLFRVLQARTPSLNSPDTIFRVPQLENPEMDRLIAAEMRLLLDDSHLLTEMRVYATRHLIRCGLSIAEVGLLLGITEHSARAAALNASSRIALRLNNIDDYTYSVVNPPTAEDLELMRHYRQHRLHGDLHAPDVEFDLDFRHPHDR